MVRTTHGLLPARNQAGYTLFGTDSQSSVLSGLNAGERISVVYTAYGARYPQLDLPGFNGEHPEPVTGHYLLGNGYRAFNPVLMRFNSPDSLSPFGEGGINAYAYCAGDPVNRVDPTGGIPSIIKPLLRFFNVIKKPAYSINTRMKKFTPLGAGAFTFEDRDNKGLRLNISAHGEQVALIDQPARIVINNKLWSAQQLHEAMVGKGYQFRSYAGLRFIFCGSARGGSRSFAAEFSALANKPVTGFRGEVSDNHSVESVTHVIRQFEIQYPDTYLRKLERFYARKKLIISRRRFSAGSVTFESNM